MQLTMAWTRPISSRVVWSDLWAALEEKAIEPMRYVPAINDSRVVSRDAVTGEVVRQIVRGSRHLVQRIVADEEKGIITFTNEDESDFARIRNIVEVVESEFTLTLELTLTEEGSQRAIADQLYLVDLVADFDETSRAMTEALQSSAIRR